MRLARRFRSLASMGPEGDTFVKLPLVSIIISNYNYGKYVAEAVASSFAQDYPGIEVIVVDDVSTDDSIAAIEQALSRRTNGRLIKRLLNGGQGAALFDGFRVSSGDFIVFLDADDILLPDFVGTHVYTHFALPWQVAFTSSHLVHIGPTGRILTSSAGSIRNTFSSTPNDQDVRLKDLKIDPKIDSFLNNFAKRINRCIYLPADRPGYQWSPCSGLFFKRGAIEQIAFDEAIRSVRVSADFYFTLAHFFNGSAIIDATLGAYRIHGKNNFSGDVLLDQIDGCHRMPKELFIDILRSFSRCVIDSRLEYCSDRLGASLFYPNFLQTLQTYAGYVNRGSIADPRIFAHSIVENFDRFASVIGQELAIEILHKLGFTEEELARHNIPRQ